jgi:thiosulfate dehydrogenase [quinone] large subunit
MKTPDPATLPTTQSTIGDTSGMTLAFLLLRGWLGIRALVAGIEKFSAKIPIQQPLLNADGTPDASGAIVEIESKVYGFSHYHALPSSLQQKLADEPLLLSYLTTPFYAVLGYVLIALGLALLLGLFTRATLFGMGLLYIMLTVGLMLISQDPGVAWLGIHVGLVAMALALVQHNRYTITRS